VTALLVLLLVAALATAAAFVLVAGRKRRIRARPAPATRYPVVLAHGLFGFDALDIGFTRQEYFRGIPERMRKLGAIVHVSRVAPVSAIATRAKDLAEHIRQLDAPRVNIVAHSMGGLDARYAISRLGLSDRVASLTTIGTPHRGTPLADLGDLLLGPLLALFRLYPEGIADLTSGHMSAFNRSVPDVEGVAYQSVIALRALRRAPARAARTRVLSRSEPFTPGVESLFPHHPGRPSAYRRHRGRSERRPRS
jgi:triacylglycerol lipase